MRISSIHLTNFKRFTDLRIEKIPKNAKLVVAIGPSGCGKSSLFDALLLWHRMRSQLSWQSDQLYYQKNLKEALAESRAVEVSLHEEAEVNKNSLYIRTAYRNDPDFNTQGISRPLVPSDELRFHRLIENDQTVSNNYNRLVYDTMSAVYDAANNQKSVSALREELIGQVRNSMVRVFGDLVLNSISDPLGGGAFYFKKGEVASYHYKNLSGGEKAAFDLLLDLHIKKRFYPGAIYCIDEVETHLHTGIQGALTTELVSILDDDAQLWITTHSLGVLRAAQAMEAKLPGSVAIIDFDGIEPDQPAEISPSSLNRVAWEKLLSVTLGDISKRVAPKFLVLCEGSSKGNRRRDFDAEIYNQILGQCSAETVFVSADSCAEATKNSNAVVALVGRVFTATSFVPLIDRDDRTDQEVAAYEGSGGIVLSERNIESYLLADDVIAALLGREGKTELIADAIRIKQQALQASVSRGNPSNDLKSAAGEIYNRLKVLLGLRNDGSNSDAFLRYTMAPLIKPGMPTFEKIKKDIVDRLKTSQATVANLAAT